MEQVPFAYMILEHFPGRDLRYELEGMTHEQMTELAQQIISYQRSVSELPEAPDSDGFQSESRGPSHPGHRSSIVISASISIT